MKILFVRHGAAEKISAGGADAFRALTEEGIREFNENMKRLAPLFAGSGKITIFSSPLLRALETAEIIADRLDIRELELADSLAEGDFSAFLQAVEGREGMVIAVGHNPSLTEWAEGITSCSLKMKKGGAFLADVDLIDGQGELLFYFNPGLCREEKGHV